MLKACLDSETRTICLDDLSPDSLFIGCHQDANERFWDNPEVQIPVWACEVFLLLEQRLQLPLAATIHNLYIQYNPIKLLVDSCGATV